MRLIVGLLVAVLFVATCRKAIKRVPGVFYAAAIVLVALHLYGTAKTPTTPPPSRENTAWRT